MSLQCCDSFLGNLAVSSSRPSALRTDLTVGVLLSEQCDSRVPRLCYRCRVFDEQSSRPPCPASQTPARSFATFIRLSTWAPPEGRKTQLGSVAGSLVTRV